MVGLVRLAKFVHLVVLKSKAGETDVTILQNNYVVLIMVGTL